MSNSDVFPGNLKTSLQVGEPRTVAYKWQFTVYRVALRSNDFLGIRHSLEMFTQKKLNGYVRI